MTTLVMVKKAGVVSIAGDSQSTFGETRVGATYDARYNKIFRRLAARIAEKTGLALDGNAECCRAGNAQSVVYYGRKSDDQRSRFESCETCP